MVPLVQGQWAEVRTLAIGAPCLTTTTDGQAEVQVSALSYFSRLTSSSSFGELATLEIHRRGVETAGRVGAVVDGAEWCQTFIDLHAPQAVRILDFPHAAEYIEAIGQTAGADGPLLAAATRRSLCHDLKHSGATSVLAQVQRIAAEAGYPAETATQVAYLEKRREQMDYPRFRAEQWPIGSGMVESANKLVVEERLKGAGMHWAEVNVNPLLALRNAICNDRWAEVWPQIEDDQRRTERARRQERPRGRRLAALPAAEAPTSGSREGGVRLVVEVTGPSAAAPPTATRPRAGTKRPAADHPWNKAWSLRRQREIASTT
jgi:hypothetical protein